MPMGINGLGVAADTLTARGEEIILTPAVATALTPPAINNSPVIVVLNAQGGGIRVTFAAGDTPTGTTGFLIADGGELDIQIETPTDILVIMDTATTGGSLNANYFTYATLDEV